MLILSCERAETTVDLAFCLWSWHPRCLFRSHFVSNLMHHGSRDGAHAKMASWITSKTFHIYRLAILWNYERIITSGVNEALSYLSKRGLFPRWHRHISARGALGEFETVMQRRDAVEGLQHSHRIPSTPRVFTWGYVDTEKSLLLHL